MGASAWSGRWSGGVLAAGVAVALVTACQTTAIDSSSAESTLAPPITDEAVATAIAGRLRALATSKVPRPRGGTIVNDAAAVRLGKALFWDVQAGSDGQTACATCHHRAGAEERIVSQGVVARSFIGISSEAVDVCKATGTERQLTTRNAPTALGAVFLRDLFWDGRASHVFNGIDPSGVGGEVRIDNAALASQAVGPANNEVEMACAGRPFNGPNSLATKLLGRSALTLQHVDPNDSVLGELSAAPEAGLRCGGAPCSYRELVRAAFGDAEAERAEAHFSRIWGEAIQAYEATLVPDDTPLDRYLAGDTSALTNSEKFGLWVFSKPGNCIACHTGPELSDASHAFIDAHGLVNSDGGDQGFHNVGASAVARDLGRASHSASGAKADRGAFKTPMLRNVKLTAPYFHDGSQATLRDVVVFYSNWSDHAENIATPVRQVSSLVGHNPVYTDAIVDFLENALTDCRVETEHAPFDHPSLAIPNGPSLPAVGAAGTGACAAR